MNARSSGHAGKRVLMTVDAVGGVWRYALDLAAGLRPWGFETIFACFGPPPTSTQANEASLIGKLNVVDAPLDWMVDTNMALKGIAPAIGDLAVSEEVDLLHLNLPSQAAALDIDLPVLITAHSCVCTWFQAVRGHQEPDAWAWQRDLNGRGFKRARAVVMPSQSHATLSTGVYGAIDNLYVVHNATRMPASSPPKENFVFAAGRWWDDGKNGKTLDKAAAHVDWPVVMAGANLGPNGQYLALENARYRGALSHARTMDLMSKAAIVVSPSLYEPFGLVALEAARCGSALVLSDIPTYRELWDGAAIFVDPRESEGFAAAITLLAEDSDLRKALGRQAQLWSQKFTVEAQAEAISDLYVRLLSATDALVTVR